ncbi:MAG: PTS sugar transporter subunit IIA [Pseudomonadales bacterium]
MEISDLVSLEGVIVNLCVTSKKQALQNLARRAAKITGEPECVIYEVWIERERLGTTGVGNGIALPHGKLPQLGKLYGLFAQLDTPIDFDAIDEQPVDLICPLLVPESAGADNLRALARVTQLLLDRSIREKLRGSDSVEAIHALLTRSTDIRRKPSTAHPIARPAVGELTERRPPYTSRSRDRIEGDLAASAG